MADSSRRVLLVANPGGHLEQLHLLASRLPFDAAPLWVTADTAQSRSMLAGHDVRFVPNVAPRDLRAAVHNLWPAHQLFREHNVVAAVSTGAALAVPYLSSAALRRIPAHYLESATRTDGPSLTGSILSRVPGVSMYTQHQTWAGGRWCYPGSVFDGFSLASRPDGAQIRSAVVSLGTQRGYGFRRLIDRLLSVLPEGVEVLWQTGGTDVSDLDIEGRDQVPSVELRRAITDADVVIAHAGTGIALTAFQAGKSPVLVPREHRFGEHVDDHQMLTADLLASSGLAVVRRVEELDWSAMERAARSTVDRSGDPAPLQLV